MSVEAPVAQETEVSVSTVSVEDMADYIAADINETISRIEEIRHTNPNVEFHLGRNGEGRLVLMASVSFPKDGHTISPMEYTERLVAADLVRSLVSGHMRKRSGTK